MFPKVDAILHNDRVGVAETLGLDATSMWGAAPHVVTLTTTAFGPVGPKAKDSGLDMVLAALTGHQRRAGGQEPLWYRAPMIDYACGALGAIGILMAYYQREKTGRTAPAVEASLLATALFMLQDIVQTPGGEFRSGPGIIDDGKGFSACEHLYATKDGWIALSARSPSQVAGLADWLGGPIDAAECSGDRSKVSLAIGARLVSTTTEQGIKALRMHGVWAVACEPDAWRRLVAKSKDRKPSYIATVPDETYGHVTGCFGPLVNLSRWEPAVPSGLGLPARGQHSDQLLASAGFDRTDIERLRAAGVVA
jgi:crotonobetainyl-CoA:carnitine CoA-transferase CaiB-like acyl-CoA transferase